MNFNLLRSKLAKVNSSCRCFKEFFKSCFVFFFYKFICKVFSKGLLWEKCVQICFPSALFVYSILQTVYLHCSRLNNFFWIILFVIFVVFLYFSMLLLLLLFEIFCCLLTFFCVSLSSIHWQNKQTSNINKIFLQHVT